MFIHVLLHTSMNVGTILSLFKNTPKLPLGRWSVHNTRETTLKIKYANEDNCGISGIRHKPKEDTYMYMMGYESVHK